MLRDELVSFLRAAKVADRIVTPEMRAQADYVLTGRIKHLEQVRVDKGSRTLIEVELGLRRPRDGKILYLNSFRAENDAGSAAVVDAVDSLNTALSIIYSDFLAELADI